MTSRQAKIQEDTYFRIMHILQENPDLTQRELAKELGVSVGGLNYCLRALTEKGWVKVQNFSQSKNKFGYVYILTPRGIAEKAALTSRFLKRKMEEYELLKAEIEALRNDASGKVAVGWTMKTLDNSGNPLHCATHRGVPSTARTLIWEVFFRSRGRGIDLRSHYPWIDDSHSVSTIVISAASDQGPAAVLVVKNEMLHDGRKIGQVGLVCVDEQFRSMGLCSQLVSMAVEFGRNRSLDALVLWTSKPTLYAKHGFRVDGADRFGTVSRRTLNPTAGDHWDYCANPDGLKVEDISHIGVPAFARRVLIFSNSAASITVLLTAQGCTLADWRGDWNAVFDIIERVFQGNWNLNASSDSAIYAELTIRGYCSAPALGSQRMINELVGTDAAPLPYIPLLNRI